MFYDLLTIVLFLAGWALVGFLFYCALVCFVAEFAIGNPRRTSEGSLRFMIKGVVLQFIYKGNCWYDTEDNKYKKKFPTNSCSLFEGVFWGIPLFVIYYFFVLCFIVVGGFLGFVLHIDQPGSNVFKPYQRYGKNNEKRFVAPWKFLLSIVVFVFFKEIMKVIVIAGESLWVEFVKVMAIVYSLVTGKAFIYFFVGVFIIFVVMLLFKVIRKVRFFPATREFIRSKTKGICLEGVLVDE